MVLFTWFGIVLCLSQSAILSGLNLAFFSISKIRLEIETEKMNRDALRVASLRKDSNFLLVTILWANVSVNVLLALLSGSVLTGVAAFLFSTVLITVVGEIIPQAYFSRHALSVASALSPLLRIYQILLFPVAKPTALVLDRWLGKEAIPYFRERDLRELISMHMDSFETEIGRVEGRGALNFLALDDLPLALEGEEVDPGSVITLEFQGGRPIFPDIQPSPADEFIDRLQRCQKKWIIVSDEKGDPRMVINSDEFIRDALFNPGHFNPYWHCHRPIILREGSIPLRYVIPRFRVSPEHSDDDVIDEDIVLLWSDGERRVITGSDILGRLLRGIVRSEASNMESASARYHRS